MLESKLETLLSKEYSDMDTCIQKKLQRARSSGVLETVLYEVSFTSGKLERIFDKIKEEQKEAVKVKENEIKESNQKFRKAIK